MTDRKPSNPAGNLIVQAVFASDIVMGVVIMAGADDWFPEFPELAYVGAAMAAIGAGMLLWFRRRIRREETRRGT